VSYTYDRRTSSEVEFLHTPNGAALIAIMNGQGNAAKQLQKQVRQRRYFAIPKDNTDRAILVKLFDDFMMSLGEMDSRTMLALQQLEDTLHSYRG